MENNSSFNNENDGDYESNEDLESYNDFNKKSPEETITNNKNIEENQENEDYQYNNINRQIENQENGDYQNNNINNKIENQENQLRMPNQNENNDRFSENEDYQLRSNKNQEEQQNEQNTARSQNSLSNPSPNYYSQNYEENNLKPSRTKSRTNSTKPNHINQEDLNSSRENYDNRKNQSPDNQSQDYQNSQKSLNSTPVRQKTVKPKIMNSSKSEELKSNRDSIESFSNYQTNNSANPNLLKPQNNSPIRKKSLNSNRVNVRKNSRVTDRQKSLPIEIGKSIRLLCNGDPFFRGHKFLISTRRYRYFDVFIDDISNTLKANFGAIRKIYTVEGNRIDSLDDFEDGQTYVAAGNDKFIKLNYIEISEGKRQRPHKLPSLSTDYAYQINQYEGNQSLVINVFRNGDVMTSSTKILLYKNSMVSFEAILNEISSKVKLKNGPVLKLYKINGELVFMPSQLENGFSYVAASRERFKNFDYEMINDNSRMIMSKSNSRDLPPVKVLLKNTQIKSNPKTKVDFNKITNEDIFKLQNSNHENTSFNDHNKKTYGNMNRGGFNSRDQDYKISYQKTSDDDL